MGKTSFASLASRIAFLVCMLAWAPILPAQVEGTFTHGTAKVHYRTFGSGSPLLIINGGPGMNCDGFESLAKRLGEHYLTILYDQRGTGQSTVDVLDSTTITLKAMIEDIEALRKHLGIRQWAVMGHSFGGMLACYYATLHPKQIRKLILSSSGGFDLSLLENGGLQIESKLNPAQKDSLKFWQERIAAGDTSHAARLRLGYALAPAYVQNAAHVPTIAVRLTQGNATVNALVWQDLQRIGFDCRMGLSQFQLPTLIIQGRQDILPMTIAQETSKLVPNATTTWMDNCSHYGWLDRPDIFFPAVEAFLK